MPHATERVRKYSSMLRNKLQLKQFGATLIGVQLLNNHSADVARGQDSFVPVLLSLVGTHGWWQLIWARHPVQVPADTTARKGMCC
jgi:hypothetical protein